MKKILFMISCVFIYAQNICAIDLPIKNQDVSPQQLEKQNKEIVKLAAEQLSKDLPQKVDKYTTVVKIEGKDTKLIYTFEINSGAKSDEAIKKEDHTRMERAITNGVCHSSKRFMDAQITIVYKYLSAVTKAPLFQFDINQAKCYKLFGNIQ